jgi:Ni/Co efflux regulator RcnB
MTMKTILSTLVALSVLAGVAATSAQAASFGAQEYWVERDRNAN